MRSRSENGRRMHNRFGAPFDLPDDSASTSDLMGLEVGDVIMTDQKAKEGAEILIGDLPTFRGFAGTLKGKKAIRITSQLKSPKAAVEEQIAAAG